MKLETSEFYSQNGYISLLINSIPNINNMSYLELGLDRGENFDTINTIDRTSVDSNPNTVATYYLTTDEFFNYNSRNFDIIFIDANHEYQQVLRDFQNSLVVCNRYIFLHDMFPAKEEYIVSEKCGDAYKLLYYLIEQQHLNAEIRTLNTDCGLTVIKLPLNSSYLSPPLVGVKSLSYGEFLEWAEKLPLYSVNEMIGFLQED